MFLGYGIKTTIPTQTWFSVFSPPKYEEVVLVSSVAAGSASGDPGQSNSSDGTVVDQPSFGCKEDANDQTQQQATAVNTITPNRAQAHHSTNIQWDDEQEPPSYYELFNDAWRNKLIKYACIYHVHCPLSDEIEN